MFESARGEGFGESIERSLDRAQAGCDESME